MTTKGSPSIFECALPPQENSKAIEKRSKPHFLFTNLITRAKTMNLPAERAKRARFSKSRAEKVPRSIQSTFCGEVNSIAHKFECIPRYNERNDNFKRTPSRNEGLTYGHWQIWPIWEYAEHFFQRNSVSQTLASQSTSSGNWVMFSIELNHQYVVYCLGWFAFIRASWLMDRSYGQNHCKYRTHKWFTRSVMGWGTNPCP